MQSMIFCDEATSKAFIELKKNAARYSDRKRFLSETVLQSIVEKLPVLKDKLKIIDTCTPATYKDYVLSDIGSFMGFSFAGGAMPRRISSRISGMENVFLATQWQRAPGGLPIAAECGIKAVEALVKQSNVLNIGKVPFKNRLKFSE